MRSILAFAFLTVAATGCVSESTELTSQSWHLVPEYVYVNDSPCEPQPEPLDLEVTMDASGRYTPLPGQFDTVTIWQEERPVERHAIDFQIEIIERDEQRGVVRELSFVGNWSQLGLPEQRQFRAAGAEWQMSMSSGAWLCHTAYSVNGYVY